MLRSTTASARVGRARSSSPRSLPPRPTPSRTSNCSTPTTSRSRRRSRGSRRQCMAPTASTWPRRPARQSPATRSRGSRTCRSAWRRRISRCRTTRCNEIGRRGSSSRSATSASTRVPACSCRCAVTCCRCPASERGRPRSRSTSTSTGRPSGCSSSAGWESARSAGWESPSGDSQPRKPLKPGLPFRRPVIRLRGFPFARIPEAGNLRFPANPPFSRVAILSSGAFLEWRGLPAPVV